MKEAASNLKKHIVVFVEGDTDKVFFDHLLQYYRQHSTTPVYSSEVRNLHGVTRYSNKVVGKLQNEICPAAAKKGMVVKAVCCSYDTDVFEFSERPVVDWDKVQREVTRIGIKEFYRIEVSQMIEDWILDDLSGLCSYLKLKSVPSSLSGTNAYAKLQNLFKRANKLYLKGLSIESFIANLDMGVIRAKRKDALRDFETTLNVTLP